MDIYSAELHVKKLLDYVENLADEKPRMYEKSKDRLRELADTCNKVILVISEILQEEVLQEDHTEFEVEASYSDVSELLSSMEGQIAKLKEFTNNRESKSSTSAMSPAVKKQALADYKRWFKVSASTISGYKYADECSAMLWNWLDVRFFKTVSGSTFRYNMKKFPTWIRDFVVLYGYSVHSGTSDEFMFEFYRWLDAIQNTDARNKYAVPYNVYQFGKQVDPSKLTLEAAVLWDILLDKGLRNLCKLDEDGLYLEADMLYDLLGDHNPSELDNYGDYKQDPEIVIQLGWRCADNG